MKTIAALIDFSDLTFKVLKQAKAFATVFDSQVIILHMVPSQPVIVGVGIVSPMIMQDPIPEVRQKHYNELVEMRDHLVKAGVHATIKQLDGADVNEVLAEIKKLEADLIILGSHHHSAFYNLFVGSMTSDVLRRAHCPVLVVPGDVPEPAKK